MLGARIFSPQLISPTLTIFHQNRTIPCSYFLCNTHKHNQNHCHCSSVNAFSANPAFFSVKAGFSACASKAKGSESFAFKPDEDEEEEDEEEEEEEDGEEFLPFDEMRKWLRNKPSGFGDGKTYDTSLEEKLLQEIEQSKEAQLANINNLKNIALKTAPKQPKQKKAPEVVPGTVQVRVGNLPKKKNIHRDLQAAFKGFPGLTNINPVVSGNRKTRDPICKGFAFLDLESEEAANSFVQLYSGQSLPFGKNQKQISCEITSPYTPSNSGRGQSAESAMISSPSLGISDLQEEMDKDDNNGFLSKDEEVRDQPSLFNAEEIKGGWQVGFKHVENSEPDGEVTSKPSNDKRAVQAGLLAIRQEQKNRSVKKRQVPKAKSNDSRSKRPQGSAKRLKIRERVVLTSVLSKYSGKTASAKTP